MFSSKKFFLSAGLFIAFAFLSTTAFAAGMQDKSNSMKGMPHEKEKMHEKEKTKDKSKKDAMAAWDVKDKPMLVEVDVVPQDDLNKVSEEEDQTIEVALLGSADFDVGNVDPKSVKVDDTEHSGEVQTADSNNDGFDDLIFTFSTEELGLNDGSQELTLTGTTKDGKSFEGKDMVLLAGESAY